LVGDDPGDYILYPPRPGLPPPGGEGPTLPPPTAVPEPSTWALLLIGFGVVGGILRRSKRSLGAGR
jgi:hypothetical protein